MMYPRWRYAASAASVRAPDRRRRHPRLRWLLLRPLLLLLLLLLLLREVLLLLLREVLRKVLLKGNRGADGKASGRRPTPRCAALCHSLGRSSHGASEDRRGEGLGKAVHLLPSCPRVCHETPRGGLRRGPRRMIGLCSRGDWQHARRLDDRARRLDDRLGLRDRQRQPLRWVPGRRRRRLFGRREAAGRSVWAVAGRQLVRREAGLSAGCGGWLQSEGPCAGSEVHVGRRDRRRL